MNQIVLAGCTPAPLASYLKALGVLRVLGSKQPSTRGSWHGDQFALLTPLDTQGILDFFLDEYEPTPVMAPWNGGSGFFDKDNKVALQAIGASTSPRFEAYRQCLSLAEEALAPFSRDESPKGEDKARLLLSARNLLPESALGWFDASVLLSGGVPQYPPLLGTGGNDGRLDFTNNFMQRLGEVLSLTRQPVPPASRGWLKMSLFAATGPDLVKKAIGQFSPGQAGGPNASTGFEADAAINPWDFILTIEGALMFAAAAARRNADDPSGVLSYPFTVRAVGAGAGSLGEGDAANARGELWMPLWRQPASCSEVRTLMSEGRVALGKKPARDALDFARAVHLLGGYRGVQAFQRFALLMRSGKAYLAAPVARVNVRETPASNLLHELDRHNWLERFRQFVRGDTAANRFLALRRQLEDRIFELSGREPNPAEMQALLILLGNLQQALAASSKAREAVAPVPRLSERWVSNADDGTPEFRIAKALAGLRGAGDFPLPLRAQVFPVQRQLDQWVTPDAGEKVRICTGRKGRLTADLGAWLHHRLWLMERLEMRDKPLASPGGAMLDDVAAFLESDRMDAQIAALLPGLSFCDIPQDADRAAGVGALPAAFGLMKLTLTTDRDLRSLGRLRADEHLPVPAGMLSALMSGDRENQAVRLAWRRLQASGLTPALSGALPTLAGIDPARAVAALLIPLRWAATAAAARSLLDEPEDLAPEGAAIHTTTA
jgi:CRISPR-associated protein Csx17